MSNPSQGFGQYPPASPPGESVMPTYQPPNSPVKPLLIGLLVAVLLLSGYSVLAQRQNWWPFGSVVSPIPTVSPTSGTSSWQTYRNEEYGFEVKYPADRIFEAGCAFGERPVNCFNFFTKNELQENREYQESAAEFRRLNLPGGPRPPKGSSLSTSVWDAKGQTDIWQWFTAEIGSPNSARKFVETNGIEGEKIRGESAYSYYQGFDTAYFIKGNYVFQIKAESEEFLDQILSTFKFIEPTAQTLSSEPAPGIKFQITFPPSWDGSELTFPCIDPNDAVLAVISPIKTDLKTNLKGTAAYLVQFCTSITGKAVLTYQGFIKAPSNSQPIESSKILLPEEYLQSTDEYKAAQRIISSLTITMTSYPNLHQ